MKINSIQQVITPKTTGYAATAGVGISIYSGISKNKNIKKFHKPLAYITTVLIALHIGLIEYYHNKFKSKKEKN